MLRLSLDTGRNLQRWNNTISLFLPKSLHYDQIGVDAFNILRVTEPNLASNIEFNKREQRFVLIVSTVGGKICGLGEWTYVATEQVMWTHLS